MEKIVTGVVVGPGAMLCTIWGEREDALVHAWKAEGRRGSELIQSWVSCKTDVRCNLSNDLRFFSEEHAPFGKDTVSVESICMYSCLGIIYQPFYLHPNLRPRSKECTFAHVDISPSTSKHPGTNKVAEKLSQPSSAYSGAV